MAITRAQQAKQLLNKVAPKGEKLAYINDKEAKLLKKMGGAGIDVNGTGIKSYYYDDASGDSSDYGVGNLSSSEISDNGGGGYTGPDRAAQIRAAGQAAARAEAEAQRQERERQERIQNELNELSIVLGKTPAAAKNRTVAKTSAAAKDYIPPPEEEEETLLNKALGYGKDVAIGTGKGIAKNVGAKFLGIDPLSMALLSFAGPKIAEQYKQEKNLRDARSAKEDPTGLFSEGLTRGKTPTTVTPDGDNEFPLIQAPFMIQPSREVIEEEPTPYDFDLYAARDNRVARRFAQGGRTGFNMGGMEEENLQAGAPDLRLEGNQIPQQEEMASMPDIDAELYQLFMDALRKGEVPPGTTFDAYKQLMMQMMSQQQGGQMQEGIMQAQMMEPEREMAAYGGIMGSDGRRAYGIGSFFKKAARKAKSAVKKILKSDVAKAALLAAVGAGLGSFTKSAAAAGTNKSFNPFVKGSRFSPQNLKYAVGMKSSKLPQYLEDLKESKDAAKLGSIIKLGYTENEGREILKKQRLKDILSPTAAVKNTGMSQGMNLAATLGIPAVMGLVYSQGKADEKPMDENTLARIEGYNNPLFQDGIAGARARILAGDNTGFSFRGPDSIYAAEGGRIGYQDAGPVRPEINRDQVEMLIKKGADNDLIKTFVDGALDNDINQIRNEVQDIMRNNKAEGGLMNLGGNEMDLRGGGFVPLGAKEKADDVPARLSKNEFVFTADAVRAAGGGSVDKGAEKMYNTMKRLEGVMA